MSNVNTTTVNTNDDYSARKFFYNNSLFITQVGLSVFVIGFSAGMLIIGRPAEVYLPLITAIVGFFLPSPVNHKVDFPSNLQRRLPV